MVQTRLTGLPAAIRRVMRAASVFGEACWPGGITALLGGEDEATGTAEAIAALVREEVLVPRSVSRLPGEAELVFRHALLREGAYAMLTAADRVLGHRLAAQWLEQAGERDPLALAGHCERGQDSARAGQFFVRAAEQALRGNDTTSAADCARRGLAGDPSDEQRIAMLVVLCEAVGWRNEMREAGDYATQALALAVPGTALWARAVWARLWEALRVNSFDELVATLELVRSVSPTPEATASVAWSLATGVFILDISGELALADVNLRRVHEIVEPIAAQDPIARGVMGLAHVHHDGILHEDPWSGLQWAEAARASFREARHDHRAALAQVFVGMNHWLLGSHEAADRELRGAVALGAEYGGANSLLMYYFIANLAERGALDEARREATRVVGEYLSTPGLPVDAGRAHLALADVLHRLGETATAEAEVQTALARLDGAPLERAAATALLAAILLSRGRTHKALVQAEAALAIQTAIGSFGLKGSYVRLIHAEALHAVGDHVGGAAAITAARDHLRMNAAKIPEGDVRRGFLAAIPEHARTLALAEKWQAATAAAS